MECAGGNGRVAERPATSPPRSPFHPLDIKSPLGSGLNRPPRRIGVYITFSAPSASAIETPSP